MRLLHKGATASRRAQSATRRSECPKPVESRKTAIPQPAMQPMYCSSPELLAAYCITKIPPWDGTPASDSHMRSLSFGFLSASPAHEQGCKIQGGSWSPSHANPDASLLCKYPAASCMIDRDCKAPGEAGCSCWARFRDEPSGKTDYMLMNSSSEALERVKQSLQTLHSSMREESECVQNNTSDAEECTFDAIRLKLARHRTDVLGAMMSLRQALQHEVQRMLPHAVLRTALA